VKYLAEGGRYTFGDTGEIYADKDGRIEYWVYHRGCARTRWPDHGIARGLVQSSVIPRMAKFFGSNPSLARLKRPGTSLRLVKSPDAANSTKQTAPARLVDRALQFALDRNRCPPRASDGAEFARSTRRRAGGDVRDTKMGPCAPYGRMTPSIWTVFWRCGAVQCHSNDSCANRSGAHEQGCQ